MLVAELTGEAPGIGGRRPDGRVPPGRVRDRRRRPGHPARRPRHLRPRRLRSAAASDCGPTQEPVVYAPEYRREIEDPVAGAIAVPRACPIVITEGNYLLHPDPAWRRVREQLDEVWFLEAPDEGLRVERLIERHERFGKAPERAARPRADHR